MEQNSLSIRNRLRLEWLLVLFLCTALVAAIISVARDNRADLVLYDYGQRFRNTPVSDQILLVRIDDESLAAMGQWPWPRETHAQLIRQLQDMGARAVGLDILFSESAAGDGEFGQAMLEAEKQDRPMRVVLAMSYMVPGLDGTDSTPVWPTATLSAGAPAAGHVMQTRDADGVVRSILLQYGDAENSTPTLHLAEQLYRLGAGRKAIPSHMFQGAYGADRNAIIPFASESSRFRSVSYAALLAGEVPVAFVRNKIVIVGAAAPGLGDVHPMPDVSGDSKIGAGYGMDLVAHSLNAMLVGASIHRIDGWLFFALSALPLLLTMMIIARLRPALSLPLCAAVVFIIIGASIAALSAGIWFAPSAALAGVLLAYPLWSWRRLSAIDAYVGRELSAFAVSQDVDIPTTADRILPDPAALRVDRLRQAVVEVDALRRFVANALDQLPDPMLVTDLGGIVRLANRAATHLFARNLLGQALAGLLPDADKDSEYESISANRFFNIRRAPLATASGELRGDIWYLADITVERRAQEEREMVLRFLSHDMRSPQASILALLENNPKIDAGLAGEIRHHAYQTLGLADNFIQLARLQASGIDREPMDLVALLYEARDDFHVLARQNKSEISVEIDPEVHADGIWISGDPHALRRMLGNLIDNAIKYGGNGVGIAMAAHHLPDGRVSLSMSDTGPGIPAAARDTIFAAFQQGGAAGATGTKSSGAGLGLTFAYHVVSAHGGTISLSDAQPHGARFTINLPALDDAEG